MENKYIQDYSYDNSFWEKEDFLYNHSISKFKEYLSIGDISFNLADCIENFCVSLISVKNYYKEYEKNDTSSRGKAIQRFFYFINKIVENLKKFEKILISISNKIYDKKAGYESKNVIKKMCEENLQKYENNLKILSVKKNSYYESINQTIEQYLNNLYKNNEKKNLKEIKAEYITKKKNEYKEQIMRTENYRIEYIELQRNIFSSEEEFEKDCTNDLKLYLKKIIYSYNELLKIDSIDKEIIYFLDSIDGIRDNQVFAAKNRNIISCPPRIKFIEYNQNADIYSNLEVVKNQLKNKTKEEAKNIQNQIGKEVKKLLDEILKTVRDEIYQKFEEIVNNMLNNTLTEEDYNYLVDQFQKSYDDFKLWEREHVGQLDFKKVGERWDNRFSSMKLFLDIFNKARTHNKVLNEKNFNFFIKAIEKILSFNDNEDIDYKLCELLLTLSSTFYTVEKKDEKEIKKYASEIIKISSPLIQKLGFWVGLTKYELNEEIIKERLKESKSNNNKISISFLNNISLLNKKKNNEKKDNQNILDKNIIAKLMSISYNLVQFIIESDTLNNTLASIFRNFKISQENRQMVIQMMNFHIESEKIENLKIDEEMLLNFDNIENFIISDKKEEKKMNKKDEIIGQKEDNQINAIINNIEEGKENNNNINIINNINNNHTLSKEKIKGEEENNQ